MHRVSCDQCGGKKVTYIEKTLMFKCESCGASFRDPEWSKEIQDRSTIKTSLGSKKPVVINTGDGNVTVTFVSQSRLPKIGIFLGIIASTIIILRFGVPYIIPLFNGVVKFATELRATRPLFLDSMAIVLVALIAAIAILVYKHKKQKKESTDVLSIKNAEKTFAFNPPRPKYRSCNRKPGSVSPSVKTRPVPKRAVLIGIGVAAVVAIVLFSLPPIRASRIYQSGYQLLHAGEFQQANERFAEAFNIDRNRNWFYRYAEAFLYHWQLTLVEQKYEMLLRYFPRDRKGVLDFAYFQTNYMRNYAQADNIIRRHLLDFYPDDFDALLAVGDNALAWGEIEPARFEDARIAFARVLETHGWTPPVVERMLRFFIRTDNLREVLHLRNWFDAHPRRTMQASTLAELGGYLLDKQFEEVRGVPNEFRGQIRGVPDILLEAVRLDPNLPDPHYHLSRFYHSLGRNIEERIFLEQAIRALDNTREESVRRLRYRIDAHRRYADVLINDREFIPAEEQLVRGVNLYEDGIRRRILTPSPNFGRLFAGLGDLEYFTRGVPNMETALNFYRMAERHGWAPPEMLFRMGVAYYNLESWGNALEYFFVAASELPLNRRVLFALGNSAFKHGDYFAAWDFYNRLLTILEGQRSQLSILLPDDNPEYLELTERLMMVRNNAGVASERFFAQTGDLSHRTRALALYAEAQRAWDARTRDPTTMIRSGSVPLPHLNMRNALHPQPGFEPQIFVFIDRDALETSPWERLVPQTAW